MTLEQRWIEDEVEVRQVGGKPVITGYAAVFDKPSRPMYRRGKGRFVETVEQRAFNKTIGDRDPNIVAITNHDPEKLLGRTGAGTLRLSVEARGLHYEIDPPSAQHARDLVEAIERRDAHASSFGFQLMSRDGEEWAYGDDGIARRSLKSIRLRHVSPLMGEPPAYEDATTELSVRSLEALCELRGLNIDDLDDQLVDALFDRSIDLALPEHRNENIPDVLRERFELVAAHPRWAHHPGAA